MSEIFIMGFIVLGTYKLFELFVKKKERLMIIEKLISLPSSTEAPESIRLPKILFEKQDYGSWPLRISLLLIGIGLGCLTSVFIRLNYINNSNWNRNLEGMVDFACICFFGGLGLFIAFLIEWNKNKK